MKNPFKALKEKREEQNTINGIKGVFASHNMNSGDVVSPENKSRSDVKKEMADQMESSLKKRKIIDELKELKRSLSFEDKYESSVKKVEDLINKIDRMHDGMMKDKASLMTTDTFLHAAIENAHYCFNSCDLITVNECLKIIDGYATDRLKGRSYYKNQDYIDMKLERDDLYTEIIKDESEIRRLAQERQELKHWWETGEVSERDISRRLENNRKEERRITARIDDYKDALDVFDESINQLQQNGTLEPKMAQNLNRVNTALLAKHQNERNSTWCNKVYGQITTSHKKVGGSSLRINEEMATVEDSPKLTDSSFD